MNDILFYFAAGNVGLAVAVGVPLVIGNRRIRKLQDTQPLDGPLPKVSVVVAARNEERNIAAGMRSLLALDYDNIEIMVVNDRSTDKTGEILAELAAEHPRLQVVRIDTLPDGWLGKNHALHFGAKQATGDILLFTDADVVMQPSVLRRAVRYLLEHDIDHLPMLFQVRMPSWLLESFVITFSVFFFTRFRPWKVQNPKSAAHVGVGGFNMIRRETYEGIGTYEAIRMRPDDDVKLGKLVKKHGRRQAFVNATSLMYVPWYSSFREMLQGLEKNAFAALDYSIPTSVFSSSIALAFNVFPFAALLFTSGATWWLYVAADVLMLATCMNMAYHGKARVSCAVAFPLASLILAFVIWRTMVLNLRQGGIRWRDTFYPLAELKAHKM